MALQAHYVFDILMNYLRPTTWDLDFYDRFFEPGAYLPTHAEHMERRHDQPEGE